MVVVEVGVVMVMWMVVWLGVGLGMVGVRMGMVGFGYNCIFYFKYLGDCFIEVYLVY